MVGDHSAKETRLDRVSDLRGIRVGNSSSQANRIEGMVGIVEFNEAGDTGGVGRSKGFVVGVEATVEAGARIQKGCQGGWVGGEWWQAQGEGDGG